MKNIFTKGIMIWVLLIKLNVIGQNGSAQRCINAEPLCGSQEFYYPNTSGVNFSESGHDYGCLNLQLNPAWFYLQIEESGNIVLRIEQATDINSRPNLDVDFVLYGPFSNSTSACKEKLESSNIIDCSYSSNYVENVRIHNAKAGDYYLLLITNFSIKSGFIKVTQTEGAATTNCNILNEPSLTNSYACQGDILNLDATTTNASYYDWYEINDSEDYDLLEGFNTSKIDVSESKAFRAIAYDINNVLLEVKYFNVTFYENVKTPLDIEYNICDNFEDNDGIAMFDLKSLNSRILNEADESIFSVAYFDTYQNALDGIESLPYSYTNTTKTETIYVRVQNTLSGSLDCHSIGSVFLSVNLLPSISLNDSYILCLNTNGTETIPPNPILETGLNSDNYNFIWKLNGNILNNQTSSLLAEEEGDYHVLVKNVLTGCSNNATTFIITSSPPILFAEITSQPFSENHIIEARVVGVNSEEYEFCLDNGIWQSSGTFNNVSFGEHIVSARDAYGCGISSVKVMVIDYPHYFTPNGDGHNDKWQITGLNNQRGAVVFIFDRYGKVLKRLDNQSLGWDGTYNGKLMPNGDYWFNVEYYESITKTFKIFKSHFTLKR